jgi:hypothetical protein
MEEPSTRRKAAGAAIAAIPYERDSGGRQTNAAGPGLNLNVHYLFSVRNMFFCATVVLAGTTHSRNENRPPKFAAMTTMALT